MTTSLHPIRTSIANLYLVVGDRPVLIDTGNPGNGALVIGELARLGFAPTDLALIVLTHAHGDHLGSASELRRLTGAPIALHRADLEAARSGRQTLHPSGWDGALLHRFFATTFEPLEPDIVFDSEVSLEAYGIAARVLETPGHTAGSISVLLQDGQCVIADVVRGSFLMPNRPARHFFADDQRAVTTSIQRLLSLPATRFHVGHGHSFHRSSLQRRFASLSPIRREVSL